MEGVLRTLGALFGLVIAMLPGSIPAFAQEEDSPNATQLLYDALLASRLGQWDDALELADKAIALDPDYQPAWAQRAEAYLRLGLSQKAEEDQRRLKAS